MSAVHRWETTSSHVTSEGWVRYQRCGCGATRVLLGADPVGTPSGSPPGMIASGAGLSLSDDHHAGDVGRDG
jgi:hypothetical protein